MQNGQKVFFTTKSNDRSMLVEGIIAMGLSSRSDVHIIKETKYSFDGMLWADQSEDVTYTVEVKDLDRIYEDLQTALDAFNEYNTLTRLHDPSRCTQEYPKYQILTADAVRDMFLSLLVANGATTTLEVKKELRLRNYFAEQTAVSNFMEIIATELDIPFTDNGKYRTYTQKNVVPTVDVMSKSTGTISDPANTFQYNMKDGRKIIGEVRPAMVGEWNVSYCMASLQPLTFAGTYTRDEVRNAYSKIMEVKMHDVRSMKIK